VFYLAISLYIGNLPQRDMSDDTRNQQLIAQLQQLPENSLFYTGVWQPEGFITLEYLQENEKGGPVPVGTSAWWAPLDDMRNLDRTVYIGTAWRSEYGLFAGATWFQEEQHIAFSGTHTEMFLQARPVADPRLLEEANQAIVIQQTITPEIQLYSYTLDITETGLKIGLYWQATEAIDQGYAVYTHLRMYDAENMCNLDSVTALLAQDDSSAPVEGAYPTHLWTAGQIVKDTYFIPFTDAMLDNAALVIGMTSHTNGGRQNEFCLPLLEQNLTLKR